MREISEYTVNEANDMLSVAAIDEPGSGGANHHYRIDGPEGPEKVRVDLRFQNGPIKESGVNGITHEALLKVIIDRLQSFQEGKYACAENDCALSHLRIALDTLRDRTVNRRIRGVEGTHKV